MKIVYFNAKAVEKQSIEEWKNNNPEINLLVTNDEVSENTKELLEGADAIVLSQIKEISDDMYKFAKEQGVKVMSTRSAGFDMYNRPLLDELDIKLTSVPSYSPNAIAEYVVTAALQLTRNTSKIKENVDKYNFTWAKDLVGREMRTLTVGLIGTGRIGTAAAKLFSGLGATVIGFDPYPNDHAKEYLTYVDSLDDLVRQSDILSLHMPAIKEYHHLVNDELISKLPDQAIIINAARGMLVDTKAVIRGLDSGKLHGAALDVYENESSYIPKDFSGKGDIEDDLLKEIIERDDIIYTPHTAYFTKTAIKNLVHGALDSAKNLIETGNDENLVEFKK